MGSGMNSVIEFFELYFIRYKLIDETEQMKKVIDKTLDFYKKNHDEILEEYNKEVKRFAEKEKTLRPYEYERFYYEEDSMQSFFEDQNSYVELFYEEEIKLMIFLLAKTFENNRTCCKRQIKDSYLEKYKKEIDNYFKDSLQKRLKELYLIYNCFKHNDDCVSEELAAAFSKYKLGKKIKVTETDVYNYYNILATELKDIYFKIEKLPH